MFSPLIPHRPLANLCRNLASLLDAGVPILKALRTSAKNAGNPKAQRALEAIEQDVRGGQDFASAVKGREEFPPLAAEMIAVAEETGQLPEILRHLAEHYDNLVTMRRMFLAAIAWPVFQLVGAILIIALLILILGWVASFRGGDEIDVLGWGLTGTTGAIIWLLMTFGTMFAIFITYKIVSTSTAGKQFLHPWLMRIPVVGNCMRSFALARFSWALALTQQTGMGIDQCLNISLRATSNGAYIGQIPKFVAMVRSGDEIADVLGDAPSLFPEGYRQSVEVADTSGTLPESLTRMSPQLENDARRSLAALTIAASWVIWLIVAVFIIFLIFSLFSFYIGQLNEAMKGI